MATQKDFRIKNGLIVQNGNTTVDQGTVSIADQISGDTGQLIITNGQSGSSFMRIGIIGSGTANSHIRTDSTLEFHIGQSATSTTPSVSINTSGNIQVSGNVNASLVGANNIDGLVLQLNGTTVVNSSRNIVNVGTISNSAFTIPNSIGTAGQVLKVPSSGTTLEWGNSSSVVTGITNFADNRLLTASGSTTINGESNLTFDGATLGVVGDISLGDNKKIYLGTGNETEIYFNGSNSYFLGTGNTFYTGATSVTLASGVSVGSQTYLTADYSNGVKLYHTGAIKAKSTATGFDVTGTISSGAITSSGASSGRYTGLEVVNTTNAGGTETAIGLGVVATGNNACDVKLVANRVGANSGSDFYIEQTDASGNQDETFRITEDGNATFSGAISSGAITSTGISNFQRDIRSAGQIRATGWYNATATTDYTGMALEIGVSGTQPHILAYNRDTSSYGNLVISSAGVLINPRGNDVTIQGVVNLTSSGHLKIGSTTVIDSSRKILNLHGGMTLQQDGTYGSGYGMLSFSGTTNGHNRIFGANTTNDGLYLMSATGHNVHVRANGNSNTNITLGEDGTYANYSVIGFQSQNVANGTNRIFARNNGADGLYICSATSRQITFRTNGGTANTFAMTSGGNFQMNNTTVIDSSRNLSNIGTISSLVNANRFLKYRSGSIADFEVSSDNNSNAVMTVTGTGTADIFKVRDNTNDVFTIADGGNSTFAGNLFAKNVVFVGGNSYNENIRMHPSSNDYSSLVLGAVSGNSGTGTGQWTLVRYPTATYSNKFTIRHNSTDFLTINTSGNTTFAGTISSGAITSSASITASGNSNNFGNTTIAALSATSGTFSASVTASGNSNSFGNSSFGTISSGAITSTGNSTFSGVIGVGGTLTNSSFGVYLQNNKWYATQYSSSHDVVRMNANTAGGLDIYNQTDNGFANVRVGSLNIEGTTVINSSRNLTNIGTISSGAVTSSSTLTTQADSASAGIKIKRTNSSTAGARGYIGFMDSDNNFVASIDSRGTGVNNSGDLRFFTSTGQSYSGVYNNPSATLILDTDNSATFAGTISSSQNININASGTNNTHLEVGSNTNASHYSFIDIISDTTYSDYGLRIIRNNTGANSSAYIYHRGTGNFNIETQEAANIRLRTAGQTALTIDASKNANFQGDVTTIGYVQHYGNLYSRNNLRVLNAAGNGWHGWAIRSNGTFNLDVGTISSGDIDVSATNTNGLSIIDSSNSSASPLIKVQGNRQDANESQSFTGGLALSSLQTNALANDGKHIGTIYFGTNHTNGTAGNIAYSASISARLSGAANSATDMPTDLVFYTGSSGHSLGTANTTFGTQALKLDSSQNATFAGTIDSGAITSTSSINSSGGYYVSSTEVIDASRNLTNIASYNGYTPTKSSSSTNSVISLDSRNVNSSPSARNNGLYVDFKTQTTIGLTGSGTYAGVLTFRSYGSGSDLTGGYPIQIAYDEAGNLQTRYGSSSSAWGSWKAIHLAGNDLSSGTINSGAITSSDNITADGTNAYILANRSATNRRSALVFTTNASNVNAQPPATATIDYALGVTDSDEVSGNKFFIKAGDTNASGSQFFLDSSGATFAGTLTANSVLLSGLQTEVLGVATGKLLVGAVDNDDIITNIKGFGGSTSMEFGDGTINAVGSTTINHSKSSATNPILTLKNTSTTNEGRYVQFLDNAGVNIGQIGHVDQTESNIFIATFSTGLKFESYITYKAILPCGTDGADSDNSIDLGSSSVRFDDIYATNGTIQTSDRNLKQDIQALTDAEQRVATACKGLIRRFRWQDSVAEKDNNPDSDETARYHFGVIAQDLQDAFEAEGLDASDYGMFISSTWTDDDGVEQTRLGVRYNELLSFIITTL